LPAFVRASPMTGFSTLAPRFLYDFSTPLRGVLLAAVGPSSASWGDGVAFA
jgi:hypothetical protein